MPQAEHIIVFFDESEGWVEGPVFATVPGCSSDAFFFDLAAPGPLPFAGALVDPLVVSLHSGGSWWSLFVLFTGGACGGPPACVVGAVGAFLVAFYLLTLKDGLGHSFLSRFLVH